MKVAFLLLLAVSAVFGYSYTNTIVSGNAPKFNPTNVQKLIPRGTTVLTTHPANAPLQNPTTDWTEGWARVVAVGSGVTLQYAGDGIVGGLGRYPLEEGDTVIVPACTNPVNLNPPVANPASVSFTAANALYCAYDQSQIIARVNERSYGGNQGDILTAQANFFTNNGAQPVLDKTGVKTKGL